MKKEIKVVSNKKTEVKEKNMQVNKAPKKVATSVKKAKISSENIIKQKSKETVKENKDKKVTSNKSKTGSKDNKDKDFTAKSKKSQIVAKSNKDKASVGMRGNKSKAVSKDNKSKILENKSKVTTVKKEDKKLKEKVANKVNVVSKEKQKVSSKVSKKSTSKAALKTMKQIIPKQSEPKKPRIYKEPNKSETETTVNVLYWEGIVSIYTNKVDLQKQLRKVLGSPSKEDMRGRSIVGTRWDIPLTEKNKLSQMILKANLFEF
jgi:hypothetical protein